ncbi:MAG: D-aminoacyl-tRNA deacylase [Rhodocyclaceae bacterium]
MIGLIQRVSHAEVMVGSETVGRIGQGLLALIGVQPEDSPATVERMVERLLGYRVFEDEAGRMNRSLSDIGGGLLLVPQFTLAADTRTGTRAGFSTAAPPALARERFDQVIACARRHYHDVATGRFGADMAVSLTNMGPVTFWLEA